MQDESRFTDMKAPTEASNAHLLKHGLDKLRGYADRQKMLLSALNQLAEIRDDAARKSIMRLQRQLLAFEPSITMIGQVKAGKTSLINAMVGWPDLLPSDVNPWTSVVTSLHTSPGAPKSTSRARFQFFDKDEWSRLMDKGGRIGELASRAGADGEMEKIRQQVENVREKSRNRLGRRFELLMGRQHEYGTFDEEVIERYVCLGDDFGEETDATNTLGRFADITKSADLYFQRAEIPTPLCIRDTPGVNDVFLMREQITISAIRDSRICVVVLSAHQALSSIDMALIRLIANIKSREVIIFVNRIDELSDPGRQVPEIRESIRATLKDHDGPIDAEIIFGSAYWANKVLSGALKEFSMDSREALLKWAESELSDDTLPDSPLDLIWHLSGVPMLYRALSDRIVDGAGQEAIDRVARSAQNLARGLEAAGHIRATCSISGQLAMNRGEILAALDDIEARYTDELNRKFDVLQASYTARLDSSHRSFVERSTESLVRHLERHGEGKVWTYDPTGLRVLLRSAFQLFHARLNRTAKEVYLALATDLGALYGSAFGTEGSYQVEPPALAHIPPPVAIGQTIALDMRGSWWRSWWKRRRGYAAFSAEFFDMIVAETDPIIGELRDTQSELARNEMLAVLREFLAEQRLLLLSLIDAGESGEAGEMLGTGVTSERFKAIKQTIGTALQDAA